MEGEEKTNGALVGLFIIIILLIIGGIYLWLRSVKENSVVPQNNVGISGTYENNS